MHEESPPQEHHSAFPTMVVYANKKDDHPHPSLQCGVSFYQIAVYPTALPKGQHLLEHGALDMIVDRREMRKRIGGLIAKMTNTTTPLDIERMSFHSSNG